MFGDKIFLSGCFDRSYIYKFFCGAYEAIGGNMAVMVVEDRQLLRQVFSGRTVSTKSTGLVGGDQFGWLLVVAFVLCCGDV